MRPSRKAPLTFAVGILLNPLNSYCQPSSLNLEKIGPASGRDELLEGLLRPRQATTPGFRPLTLNFCESDNPDSRGPAALFPCGGPGRLPLCAVLPARERHVAAGGLPAGAALPPPWGPTSQRGSSGARRVRRRSHSMRGAATDAPIGLARQTSCRARPAAGAPPGLAPARRKRPIERVGAKPVAWRQRVAELGESERAEGRRSGRSGPA